MQNILKLLVALASRPSGRAIRNAIIEFIIGFLDRRQRKELQMTQEEWELPWKEWRKVASQRFRERKQKEASEKYNQHEAN